MDAASLASAFVAANAGQAQVAVAAKMLRMDADSAQAVVKMLDVAQQSVDRLANVAAGVGGNLDVSA
jgi:hypothetical protein